MRRLRRRAYDLVITSPRSTVGEDLALLPEVRSVRPGVKTILLVPTATPEEVIASLRAHVFACFAAPHDAGRGSFHGPARPRPGQLARRHRGGSAQPDWLTLRVNCRLTAAERLVAFLHELRPEVPEGERDEAMMGFREILLNAMEHGGRFDPDKVVEVVGGAHGTHHRVLRARIPGPASGPRRWTMRPRARRAMTPGPHARSGSIRACGRAGFGILMAKNVVDELIYSEHGNEVILIKHLR